MVKHKEGTKYFKKAAEAATHRSQSSSPSELSEPLAAGVCLLT
jgi:hypothetical protein